MTIVLCVLLVEILLRSGTAMSAAMNAARLFVTSVMPGLFPYMTLALMLISRLPSGLPGPLLVLMGWCGGSPTGAKLLATRVEMPPKLQKQVAVTCATMSPMFLIGTIPQWTGSWRSGVCMLVSVLSGGALVGRLAAGKRRHGGQAVDNVQRSPLSLGEAVEQAARAMMMVCGSMMLLRVIAALAGELFAGLPAVSLWVMTLLEVTSGTAEIARLALPLTVRTGLIGAATGFGGAAILVQNRASYPEGLLSLREQVGWQALHGLISGIIAWLLMELFG